MQAQVYKEDFEIERNDRAKAHGQIDVYKGIVRQLEEELKQTQANLKQAELDLSEQKKQAEELLEVNQRRERELEVIVSELGSARLEAQTSTSQVEEYTTELDALKTKVPLKLELCCQVGHSNSNYIIVGVPGRNRILFLFLFWTSSHHNSAYKGDKRLKCSMWYLSSKHTTTLGL